MNDYKIMGLRLKKLRKEKQMTQQEVGDMIGVNKVSIHGYEVGNRKPSLDNLIKLANYFQVSIDYLLCREVRTETNDFISSKDVEIIESLKKNKSLYNQLCKNTNRTINLIARKTKYYV